MIRSGFRNNFGIPFKGRQERDETGNKEIRGKKLQKKHKTYWGKTVWS